jgi:hypothetical protein
MAAFTKNKAVLNRRWSAESILDGVVVVVVARQELAGAFLAVAISAPPGLQLYCLTEFGSQLITSIDGRLPVGRAF